jgi:hypothetical protein
LRAGLVPRAGGAPDGGGLALRGVDAGPAETAYAFEQPFVLDTSKYESAFGAAGTPPAATSRPASRAERDHAQHRITGGFSALMSRALADLTLTASVVVHTSKGCSGTTRKQALATVGERAALGVHVRP